MSNRFNPFRLAENLIETNYRIPVSPDCFHVGEGESFMAAQMNNTVNLGEYLEFMRKYILSLQADLEMYKEYHKAAFEIKDTGIRTEYREGCRDTFGTGFTLEYDEYKEFREIYWKIEKIKNQ